ncbi:MAG: replication-associated recombination protein A [Proteobacteria bacterium]|nr:replication-associated recombination protein A [Pseudomonadota bacterium]
MNSQLGLFSAPSSDPLALKMRPQTLSDYVGQTRVVQEIQSFGLDIPHLVLWGPPGTGKTTLAHILAREVEGEIFSFNAVLSGVPELRKLIAEIESFKESSSKKAVLFIDEIHRFNKSQQDALLPYLERGDFLFIGATTEYPQTSLNRALLSRLRVLELKGHSEEGLISILTKAVAELKRDDLKEFVSEIARWSNGDARSALNTLSLLSTQKPEVLKDADILKTLLQKQRAFDKNQDRHYDVISAFIKSIRGSDPDAALLWLAVMLDGGEDPIFIARRLMILASEDVGLANSQALQVACNAHYVCQQIGMPEARITLSHATTFLALSPKSNSVYEGINAAMSFVTEHPTLSVPGHLSSVGPEKKYYKYPHAFPMHFTPQVYRPNEASLSRFYQPGTLGSEGALNEIWKKFTN